jgi:large subunit ribosomal protein L16
MGKGKGSLDRWVAKVKPGRILYEVGGVPPELAKKALESGSYKLPIKTRFVSLK